MNEQPDQPGVAIGEPTTCGLFFLTRRWLCVGVLLGWVLVLISIPVSESTAGERQVGSDSPVLSTPVGQHQAEAEPQRYKNPLNTPLNRVGVCIAAILLAGAWFLLFHRSPIRVFAGVIVALYVCLAFGVGRDFYPVSRFDMYAMLSSQNQHDPARLVARDQSGALHMVKRYSRWQCDGPIEPLLDGCHETLGPFYYIPYIDKEDIAHVTRAGPPVREIQTIELVRAVWRLSETKRGIQRVDICPLVTCRVEVGP